MNEHLLQYLWNHKIFSSRDFKDTQGNEIEVLDFGQWNKNAGPDFLFAKVKSQGLTFSGHIEIHLNSTDWDNHQHSVNTEYHNVILHVVFKHNKSVDFIEQNKIPTLELRHYINEELIQKYTQLELHNTFIPCEKIIQKHHVPFYFHEENILRKLDEKSIAIQDLLAKTNGDYEAVLFRLLAYNFGLKINADTFYSIAEGLDFNLIRKLCHQKNQLEALFLGKAGFLMENFDSTTDLWIKEYEFISKKHQLNPLTFEPKFSKLRPQNFPTIRLSQLANLYHQYQNLFAKLMETRSYSDLLKIFKSINASEYWNNHYQIGKLSHHYQEKKLSASFINLIILNTIIPLQYHYYKNSDECSIDHLFDLYQNIKPEKNTIVQQWEKLISKLTNSMETQSLLYHYKNACIGKKCLNCGIGLAILKS